MIDGRCRGQLPAKFLYLRQIRAEFKPALTKTWPTITIFSLRTKFARHTKWPHNFWLTSLCVRTANERIRRRCMSAQNSLESFFCFVVSILFVRLTRLHTSTCKHYYGFAKFSFSSFVDTALLLLLFSSIGRSSTWSSFCFCFVSLWLSFQQFGVNFSILFFWFFLCSLISSFSAKRHTHTHTYTCDSTPIPNLRTHTHTRAAVGSAHTAKKCIHEFDEDKNVVRQNGRNRNNVIWLAKRDEEQPRPHDTVGGGL